MITGVILARNEEANITDCIACFGPLVDELILIDMESTDRTIEIARPLVSTVLSHPVTREFDAARNIAIADAKYSWLWFCDADERPSAAIGSIVRNLIRDRGDEFEALTIPFKTYFCGKWIENCGWWPGYTMPRVLKRGHFRFRDQLHGGVEVNGRQLFVEANPTYAIDHFSYKSVDHYFQKFNHYTSSEAALMATAGQQWDWRSATHAMIGDLWNYYEQHNGKADGVHGWILSWLAGQYRWVAHAKLLANDGSANGSVPESLDEFFREVQHTLNRLRGTSRPGKLGIVWRTPISDASGYADEGRCFTKALALTNRALCMEPIKWSDSDTYLTTLEQALHASLIQQPRPEHFIAITNCIPTLVEPVPGAIFNVLRTTFETDRIPPEWLQRIELFDEVWVPSRYNYNAFVRSGVAPEKLRIIPSCLDAEVFTPAGPRLTLPRHCSGRFVFLSVLDWQLRKGWDTLLKAYVREFAVSDKTSLLLKISRQHGYSLTAVIEQIDAKLAEAQTSLAHRPDVVIWDEMISSARMPELYRAVDVFVLPSRGEGWGRPLMEAMACGIPTIGTAGSGNTDFMNEVNSVLVPARRCEVSTAAATELPVFRSHQWYEPDEEVLRREMRRQFSDALGRESIAAAATRTFDNSFNIESCKHVLAEAIASIEDRLGSTPPRSNEAQLRVELQGDVLANHSFSNINEYLCKELGGDKEIDFRILPRYSLARHPAHNGVRCSKLQSFIVDATPTSPAIVVKHAYPPCWKPVKPAKWVHIQPWEFGYLPSSWLEPLQNDVDEIWVPSHYVRRVFERSGIPVSKVRVIPWGVDPVVFKPNATPRLLPTSKAFKFLYVGGSIARKGFDILLTSYLREFTASDDVALVVKDLGTDSVYRNANYREQIKAAMQDPSNPQIVYLDIEMTPGQIASLFTACNCFVAPYRGEGFGLPILEAMACGLPAIVPRGGPTDDFVDDNNGFPILATEVECTHPEPLAGPPLELHVDTAVLQQAMRFASSNHELTARKGQNAAQLVEQSYTWKNTADKMKERLHSLAQGNGEAKQTVINAKQQSGKAPMSLAVLLNSSDDPIALGDALANSTAFAEKVFVVAPKLDATSTQIAMEYGAAVISTENSTIEAAEDNAVRATESGHFIWLDAADKLVDSDWALLECAVMQPDTGTARIRLSSGRHVTLRQGTNVPPMRVQGADAVSHFRREFYPYLGKRSGTFLAMLEHLSRNASTNALIVETGCIRMKDDWGAGQSTLIFDAYAERAAARFLSVDNNERNCDFARQCIQSGRTKVNCDHSVHFLYRLACDSPRAIDLLYLDSLDVDWNNPHQSALYHLEELCAALPALKSGGLVVVDDHCSETGRPGKSLYVCDFMSSIKAQKLFEGYQVGWILP